MVALNAGYGGDVQIATMLNDGTGRFGGPIASESGVVFGTLGDYRIASFRGSGHPDFVAIGESTTFSEGAQYIVFAPGNGDGTFGPPTSIKTLGADGNMAVGDFNRDGKLDFVAAGGNPSGPGFLLSVFLGNGDGTFSPGITIPIIDSAETIASVNVGDFNGDGKLDILVYDTGNGFWTTSSYVWEFLGNGDGTFQPGRELYQAFQPMMMANVNNDSLPDIVRYDFMWPDGTTETPGPAKFTTYLGQGSGLFAQSSTYSLYSGIPREVDEFPALGPTSVWSMVADLNGDGKQDEIAFQSVSSAAVYAQILAGNGDGTFTPTYDLFDFHKDYYVPRFAFNLDGTSTGDLIAVSSASSSFDIFKGGPAPALQIALRDAQVNGNASCGWVFLNIPSTSDTAITLSSSIAGVILPAGVTVSAGALSQQFCFTLDSNYDWHQVFDVRAQLGSDTEVAYASDAYVVGFSEALSSNGYEYVYPTESTAPLTVSLTSSQGHASNVQLSCEGLGVGESCTFGSNSVALSPNIPATTTVVVNTNASTPPQVSNVVTVVASDAIVTTRQSFTVSVMSLVVYSTGIQVATTSPGTATAEITILGIPPYSTSCVNQPTGISCAFDNMVSQNPNSDTFVNVNVSVAAGVTPGSYPFDVQILSGPENKTVPFALTVGDFSLQPPTGSSTWSLPGGNTNVSVGVQNPANFLGNIAVTCTTDFGGICTSSTTSFNPQGISVSVSVPSGAVLGSHYVTVSATYGQVARSVTFPFYVADYGGSLSASTLTIARGGSGPLTATVTATAGFGGSVALSCSGASQLSCYFPSPSVQPTAANPQTVNFMVTANSSVSGLPTEENRKSMAFVFAALILSAFLFEVASTASARGIRTAMGLILIALILLSTSCAGGGASTTPPTGSSNYTLTVTATAAGTSMTRTLGTVNVTVTH